MNSSVERIARVGVVALGFLTVAPIVEAQDFDSPSDGQTSIYADIPQFGGPSSVGGQITEDAAVPPQFRWQGTQNLFQPWYQFIQLIVDPALNPTTDVLALFGVRVRAAF